MVDHLHVDTCPICAEPLLDDDICATDIEMGICHAACLEGSPTVSLETGEPVDGPMDTFRYGDDEENCVVCGEHLETGDLVYWSANDDGHLHPECTTHFVHEDGTDTGTPPQPFEFRSERNAVARSASGVSDNG